MFGFVMRHPYATMAKLFMKGTKSIILCATAYYVIRVLYFIFINVRLNKLRAAIQ